MTASANGDQSQGAGVGLSQARTPRGSNTGDHKVLNTSGKGFWHHPQHLWGIHTACRPIPLWPYKDSLKSIALSGFLASLPAHLSLRRWKETPCLWSSLGPRGEWILHLKVLKLRDWILGDPEGSAFPLLIVPTKLSWQPALLFRWAILCYLSCLAVVCQDAGFLNAFPAGCLSGA